MEIILKKEVKGLGYANDLIVVKDGYARNYLIPKGYAILATKSNKKMREEILKQKSYKEEKLRTEAQTMEKALEKVSIKIGAKASEATGKIYGSVNNIQLAEALKEQFNFEIDRKKISIDGDLVKEIGAYKATVDLYKEIKGKFSFEVVAE